jgi:hypothetical protein
MSPNTSLNLRIAVPECHVKQAMFVEKTEKPTLPKFTGLNTKAGSFGQALTSQDVSTRLTFLTIGS